MQMPGLRDWGLVDENSLDAESAFRAFFGKSLTESRSLFVQNALFYRQELSSRPPSR